MNISLCSTRIAGTLLMVSTITSCATIFDGKIQKVPVRVEEGVTIKNVEIKHRSDSSTYIELRRDKDTVIQFENGTQTSIFKMERSLNGLWIIPDIFYIFPLLIDAYTKSWCYFDPLEVHTKDATVIAFTNPALWDPDTSIYVPPKKIGVVFLAGFGMVGPPTQAVLFFNSGKVGIGYQLLPQLTTLMTVGVGSYVDLGTDSSRNTGNVAFTSYQFEARFKFYEGAYLLFGGGRSHLYNDGVNHVTKPLINTASFGLGYSWSYTFIELLSTFGLSKVPLSNGAIGKFQTYTLNFGCNFTL
jgi:hypothetical protein